METYKCFFDGACEPTTPGGNMGAGIVIVNGKAKIKDNIFVPASPENTCNVAEYMALIRVLELMADKKNCNIKIYGDSMLVIEQMNDNWMIKNGAYKNWAIWAKRLLTNLKKENDVSVSWICRDLNSEADEQSKLATNR